MKSTSCKRRLSPHQPCPTQMAYWAKNYVTNLARAAHWITYRWGPHIEWLIVILADYLYLRILPNCNGNKRDKVTRIKNVKFKIIKLRTGCQYVGYFCHSENLNWAAQNPPLGHMRPSDRGLDIAALNTLNPENRKQYLRVKNWKAEHIMQTNSRIKFKSNRNISCSHCNTGICVVSE